MAFRVGLLFNSFPGKPVDVGTVAGLLQEIERRTETARNGERLSLIPFVRTNDEATFSIGVSGSPDSAAATWTECGVVFRSLKNLTNFSHPSRNQETDLVRGMKAILSLSHVIIIVCNSDIEFDKVSSLLGSFQNAWALVALISLAGDKQQFFEIDPLPKRTELVEWFIAIKHRWEKPKPAIESFLSAKTSVLGSLFPWLVAAVIRRRFETVKRKPRSEIDRCRQGMGISESAMEKLQPDDQRILNQNLELLCPFFARHDDLGRFYSNVFRTTCLLVPLLIAASTVLAVAALIDSERHNLWHVIEGVMLVTAAGLVLRSKFSKHHAAWVEHRLTAELMRSSVVCNLLHIIPQLSLPTEEPMKWVRQTEVLWTYLRSLPVLSFSTPEVDLLSARRSAVADYATYQEKFHKDFADQHYRAQKWLIRIDARAFFATLCLVVAQLVIARMDQPSESLAAKLMMATLVCASGAFVLSLLAHQLGFEAIAERSNNAADHFGALRTSIEQGAHSADAEQVYRWAYDCNQAILAEQHSWYRHIPLLRIDL